MADDIEFPLHPIEAFGGDGPGSLESRVTLFLLLGALFGLGRPSVSRDAERTREEFPVPRVKERLVLDPQDFLGSFGERYRLPPPRVMSAFKGEDDDTASRRRDIADSLVRKLYDTADLKLVGDLILLGLGDANEFIRVASAISYLDVFAEVSLGIQNLIAIASDHADELAGMMAEAALQRFGAAGLPHRPGGQPPSRSRPEHSATLLIHGTHFAFVGGKIGNWWQPGGDFHSYLKGKSLRYSLYSKPDFYTWSGGWSDHARQLAAIELRDWVRNRNLTAVDVLAHSHGGNMTMWATQLGLEINNLILLSCPEHLSRYVPEFSRVKNIVSHQIQMDWVILADGGGIYFNHSKIQNRVQNRWFRRHDDTHSPSFWNQYGLSV